MLMMIPDFTDEELSSNQSSYSKDSPLLQYHHSIKQTFGTIPPLKLSNRIRVERVRLCFLPAVAWHLWCVIRLVDVMLSWKKRYSPQTYHNQSFSFGRWEKCLVFNMSYLCQFPGVYSLGWETNYIMSWHARIWCCCYKIECLGFAITWWIRNFQSDLKLRL